MTVLTDKELLNVRLANVSLYRSIRHVEQTLYEMHEVGVITAQDKRLLNNRLWQLDEQRMVLNAFIREADALAKQLQEVQS